MTNNRYLPPVHIHPILFVFIAISFMTGTFFQLFIILSIVLFHEYGHFIVARFFKWRIRSIMLWIFGGVMETDEHGNRPLYQELLVTIGGPFQHVIIYILIYICTHFQLLPITVLELIYFYNTVILLFNLLPIYPLDGGKIIFICLTAFFAYRRAYNAILIFSMLASVCFLIVQLFIVPFNLSVFLVLLFLFMENRSEWKKRYYVFLRFLLNRYQNDASIKEIRPIIVPYQASLMDVFAQFQRSKKHSIYITYPNNKRRSIDENDCLRSYFFYKEYNIEIGEIGKYAT